MKGGRRRIIIVGSGHLAAAAGHAFGDRGFSVSHVSAEAVRQAARDAAGPSLLEHLEKELKKAGVASAEGILVLDDQDSYNIRFALAAAAVAREALIVVALFNEDIASQLQASHPNLLALSPAKVAAPAFADAVQASRFQAVGRRGRRPALSSGRGFRLGLDWMLVALPLAFLALVGASVVFFHWSEGLAWIDALYFVVAIISTVGFGDISLLHSAPYAKLFGIALMLLSLVGVWMTFSLIVDWLVKRRANLALGRKRYAFRDHVIVCGLGRIGYEISKELRQRGERVLVVEANPDNRFLETARAHGTDVYIGDGRLKKTLVDVGVDRAAAMISVINSDELNLEIGLNARTLHGRLPLVLRIFDRELAAAMRERLDIPDALSTSGCMAEHLARLLERTIEK